jgi:hypothetical protein
MLNIAHFQYISYAQVSFGVRQRFSSIVSKSEHRSDYHSAKMLGSVPLPWEKTFGASNQLGQEKARLRPKGIPCHDRRG